MKKKISILVRILTLSLLVAGCNSSTGGDNVSFQTEWDAERVRQNQEEGFNKINEDAVAEAQKIKEQGKDQESLEEFHKRLEEEQKENEKDDEEAEEAEKELKDLLAKILDATIGTKEEVVQINQKIDKLNTETPSGE
jgi:hypothetical protein